MISTKSTIDFKRSLLREIEARPVIWDKTDESQGRSDEIESAWVDIQTSLGGAPLRKLKNMWGFFCRHYNRILMTKTIERNDEAAKWILFHDMTFMYEQVTEKIRKKMGGISPPLLKPSSALDQHPCPCCLPPPTQPSRSEDFSHISPPNPPPKRRRKPIHVSEKGMHVVERKRIIDAIKAYPMLYDRDVTSSMPLWFAWKKVGEKVGIPLTTIQNRWRQFKRRYLDELMKERTSKGPFRSAWPNFEQMSFMRGLMQDEIDELDRVRREMEQLVKQKRSQATTDPESEEDIQCWRDEGQNEGDQTGVETLDLTDDDVVFLSDEEEAAGSLVSEEAAGSLVSEELPVSFKEEIICIDDEEMILGE